MIGHYLVIGAWILVITTSMYNQSMLYRLLLLLTLSMLLTACTPKSLIKGFSDNQPNNEDAITDPLPPIEISGWLPWWDWENALQTVRSTPEMKTISPFTYILEKDGVIRNKKSLPADFKDKYTIIPTISHDLEADRLQSILEDPTEREAHINDLVAIANNYHGIEVDYENIPRQYKNQLSQLIEELAAKLHAQNKLLYLALHAKTNDVVSYAGAGSLDYARLCKAADKCRVMAYDYHYSGSPTAGAVTPLYWLKEVITYSKKHIPQDKLVLALPLYGYEWAAPRKGASKTQKQIKEIIANGGESVEQLFEENSQTPFLKYGENTELWYDNEQSLKAKMAYAKSQGIYQFAFWRLGGDEGILNEIVKQ